MVATLGPYLILLIFAIFFFGSIVLSFVSLSAHEAQPSIKTMHETSIPTKSELPS